MEHNYEFSTTEEERAARRAQRIAARQQRQRERRRKLLLRILAVAGSIAVVLIAVLLWTVVGKNHTTPPPSPPEDTSPSDALPASDNTELPDTPTPDPPLDLPYSAAATSATAHLNDEVSSAYAILIDRTSGTILAEKDAFSQVNPASMTKILTILVAAEQISDMDGAFTITREITDYAYQNGCTAAGFLPGESVPLQDLFYGAILPSGADASLALACYVSGSEEKFVRLMNEKAQELGLSAHFTNCIGLYDEDHHCSVYDMAVILWAALENPICRQALSQRTCTFPANDIRPDDLAPSNWFIRRIEDHMPEQIEVIGAKTGFVSQAGSCAASAAQDTSGTQYLCVTAQASGTWRCIFDHVALYETTVTPPITHAAPSENPQEGQE